MTEENEYYHISRLMNDKDKPVLFIFSPQRCNQRAYFEFKRKLAYLAIGFWGSDITKGVCKYESRSYRH